MRGKMGGSDAIALRTASLDDAERLAVLSGQLGYPASVEQARQRLEQIAADDDNAVFVATGADGQAVGWVQAYVRQLLVVDRHAELGGLIVDDAHRGQGVGRRLMGTAEEWARARGCQALYLRSNVLREGAHLFYERIGYTQIKTQRTFRKVLDGPQGSMHVPSALDL